MLRRETHLNLKGKVLLHVLHDHHQERELDAQRLLGIRRAGDVRCAHVGAHDLNDQRLDVRVCDALNVAVPHLGEEKRWERREA